MQQLHDDRGLLSLVVHSVDIENGAHVGVGLDAGLAGQRVRLQNHDSLVALRCEVPVFIPEVQEGVGQVALTVSLSVEDVNGIEHHPFLLEEAAQFAHRVFGLPTDKRNHFEVHTQAYKQLD